MMPVITLINVPGSGRFTLTLNPETDAPRRTVNVGTVANALQSVLAQQLQLDKTTIPVTNGGTALTFCEILVVRVSQVDRTDNLTHDKLAKIAESLYDTARELTEQKISVVVVFDRLHDLHNDIRFPK